MKGTSKGTYPSGLLAIGARILAAAKVIDTKLIKAALSAFASIHRSYAQAQRKVEKVETQLTGHRVRLGQLKHSQKQTLETLARALVTDGQPRGNPFALFGGETPSAICNLAVTDTIMAIGRLVNSVRSSQAVSPASQKAAQAAWRTAQKMEAALGALELLESKLGELRRARDAITHKWKRELGALRRAARSAEDSGAPGLTTSLFGPPVRSAARKPQPAQSPPGEQPASGTSMPPAAPAVVTG